MENEVVDLINAVCIEILREIDGVASGINYSSAVKSQLLAGVDGDGKELRPRYTEDSFFHSRDEALRYVEKYNKRDVKSFPEWGLKARNWDTPNLIITGSKFHDFITADYEGGQVETQAVGSPIEGALRSKYGDKILSLSPSVKSEVEKKLIEAIKEITNKYGLQWVV